MTPGALTRTDWGSLRALAPLLVYPDEGFGALVAFCRDRLARKEPDLLEIAAAALDDLESRPGFEVEELYTRTFDLNPVCTLEVGWHLYGEQYERGRFLVRAREKLAAVGQDEGGELPDFLPSLLCVLEPSAQQEAVDLAAYLVPAVRKMCDALEDDRSNPYRGILLAVRRALEARVPEDAVETAESRYRPHTKAPKRGLVQLNSEATNGGRVS